MDFERRYFNPPAGGRHPADVYVYTDEIVLAVNVAIATRRPLLLAGPPGSGKSTLARHAARELERRYLSRVITSRTRLDDLTYGFDALRRLHDAQTGRTRLLPDVAYITPGVLWWAFDPESATWRGADPRKFSPALRKHFPRAEEAGAEQDESHDGAEASSQDVVVLLDEIDKADPDVPNDLLEPLDQLSFRVAGREEPITAGGKVLMILTTNGERELPPAFLRRCVFLELPPFDEDRLLEVARRHFGPDEKGVYLPLARELLGGQERARTRGLREPSTAEYLDAIKACREVNAAPGTELWRKVAATVLWKSQALAPGN
jgi:MoxR-like ATPase